MTVYTSNVLSDLLSALREVDFDMSRLFFEGDLLFTSEREWMDWQIENETRCGCEHLVSDHVDQGDGYLLCRYCLFQRRHYDSGDYWFGCVLDARTGYGVHPADYAKVRGEPSPDAYRWSPE
ncbi:MAG: hypothetical protein ABR972_12480 [Acidimicrobiales bacterium]|jgi:hypothetical protein